MALQIQFTTTSDISLPTAYMHITSFTGNKSTINVQLSIWKDKTAYTSNKQQVATLTARLDLTDGATFEQMYNALKLQEQFIGAIDA